MHRRSRIFTILLCALALLVAVPGGVAAAQNPTTPAEARQLYESRVADWADGPVQYIMTDEEEDLWDELETDAQRQAFKSWFWERRDPDLRVEGNSFADVFYTRVAQANERFRAGGVFRGWQSDRGRAWIVLGQPDGMRPNMGVRFDSQDWTYYTVGRDREFETVFGEFHILFVQPSPGEGYQVWDPFAGVGIWPTDVINAMDYTRQAYVVNPDLERPSELPSADDEMMTAAA